MTWPEELLDATLNGVPFRYREVGDTKGDRDITHEYPGRDEPYIQKLGKKARIFSFQAFIIGVDYRSTWLDLERELDKSETMSLIHPYRGTVEVKLQGTYRVIHVDTKGGFVALQFTLVQQGLDFFRTQTETPAFVVSSTDSAVDTVVENNTFEATGVSESVVTNVIDGLLTAITALQGVNSKVSAKLNQIDTTLALLEEIKDDAQRLIYTPTALFNRLQALARIGLRVPVDVADAVTGAPSQIAAANERSTRTTRTAVREVAAIDFAMSETGVQGVMGSQESAMFSEIERQIFTTSVLHSAGAVASVPLASRSEAIAVQREYYNIFQTVLDLPGQDPDSYEAVAQARDALIQYLVTQQDDLPSTRFVEVPETKPALLVAYELYDDISRDAEIIRRNNIVHPNYVPGGVDLEVLTE